MYNSPTTPTGTGRSRPSRTLWVTFGMDRPSVIGPMSRASSPTFGAWSAISTAVAELVAAVSVGPYVDSRCVSVPSKVR